MDTTAEKPEGKVHPKTLQRGAGSGTQASVPRPQSPGTPGAVQRHPCPCRGRKLRAQRGSRLGSESALSSSEATRWGGSPLTRLELRRQSFSSTRRCLVDAKEIELTQILREGGSQWPAPQGDRCQVSVDRDPPALTQQYSGPPQSSLETQFHLRGQHPPTGVSPPGCLCWPAWPLCDNWQVI